MPNHQLRFESVLERDFAHNILKFLRRDAKLESQVEVMTMCGVFRLDFVVTYSSDFRIAFECDGKEFHNNARDEFRDAIIIGDGLVDSIYRLRGSDLTYHVEDLIYVISIWNPEIFDDRSRIILNQLKSFEVAQGEKYIKSSDTLAQVRYMTDLDGNNMPHSIWIERQYRMKTNSLAKTWCSELYEFAQNHGGEKVDEIYAQYYKLLLLH